ncbi:LysR family transcriptional regulator [Sneathiella marina]|uniref:LysR family transcriptional regulator n=1 Tax=Sneathiella marina TaxID=2950108 RepID=A0ABY4W8L2_9PROT|nr:LysR family transcriptional regulator [Sneathiella marina]USG62267.1 LysR family transcriptional regulator [Sneathiella marina]
MASLVNMAAFVAVVEQGSFSQAGRELRQSTAVISARVAKLEQQIGTRLLYRTTRQVVPTEEALVYFERCKSILKDVEDAEAALAPPDRNPRGSITISAPVAFGRRCLAPVISRFAEHHPELQFRLQLTDRLIDLVKDKVDLAIRMANLEDSTLKARMLSHDHRVMCATPEYLARAGTPRIPSDLLKHKCLLLRFPGSTQFQWQIIERGRLVTMPVKGNLDTDNGDVLTDWVLEGRGLAVKSVWEIIEHLNSGRLVRVMLEYPPDSHPIWAVFPGGPFLSPRLRIWIDHLVGAFKSWDPHHPERFG